MPERAAYPPAQRQERTMNHVQTCPHYAVVMPGTASPVEPMKDPCVLHAGHDGAHQFAASARNWTPLLGEREAVAAFLRRERDKQHATSERILRRQREAVTPAAAGNPYPHFYAALALEAAAEAIERGEHLKGDVAARAALAGSDAPQPQDQRVRQALDDAIQNVKDLAKLYRT